MTNPDLKALLEQLQLELPKRLLERLRSGEATAADYQAARQLLKDNGYESIPTANPAAQDLASELGDVELPPNYEFRQA